MNLPTLPMWVFIVALGAIIWGSFAGGAAMARLLMGEPSKGRVFGSLQCFGCAALCCVAVLGFGLLGVFASDLSRPGNLPAWLGLLAAFGLGGLLCAYSAWGTRSRYDGLGAEFIDWRGQWHRYAWSELTVRAPFGGAGVVYQPKGRRGFCVAADSPGAVHQLIAAFDAGVPGTEQFVKKQQPA